MLKLKAMGSLVGGVCYGSDMRGLELLPNDSDDGDIFEFTIPERGDPQLAEDLSQDADDYYYGEDYFDEYW